jgi:hypothetical protein
MTPEESIDGVFMHRGFSMGLVDRSAPLEVGARGKLVAARNFSPDVAAFVVR